MSWEQLELFREPELSTKFALTPGAPLARRESDIPGDGKLRPWPDFSQSTVSPDQGRLFG